MATNSTDFARERHIVVSRERIVELRRRIVERTPREQAREKYLEVLAERVSERTGLPLETARGQVEAVAVSARKRHENPSLNRLHLRRPDCDSPGLA